MRSICIAASALLLSAGAQCSAIAAEPQRTGTATTLESGGAKPGCVAWSYQVKPAPRSKRTRQVVLEFTFVSHCEQQVQVILARQTHDGPGAAGYIRSIVLKPGQVYSGSGQVGNYVFFDPERDRWLKFWVHQADHRITGKSLLDLKGCSGKYPAVRPHAPCPPAVSYP